MIITSSQSIRQILKAKPLAAQVLEEDFGFAFWDRQEASLDHLCKSMGVNVTACQERISQLPSPSADTDWDAKPVCWLVDYLVRNHAGFREVEMPAIQNLLVEERLPAYPDGYIVKLLLQEYRHFQADFLKHMAEEEDFLFPKILRDEACLLHPELGPEVHRGSVNLYLKLETHKPEAEFKRLIVSIREKLRNQHLHRPAAEIAQRAQSALDGFAESLLAHADLETNVLFPRAGRLEQELRQSRFPGLSRESKFP
ncbi:MAG: hypothetical protein ABIW76_24275 [Fibrobacteria bacterium]